MFNLSKLFADGRPLINAFMLCFASSAVGDVGGGDSGAAAVIASTIEGAEGEAEGAEPAEGEIEGTEGENTEAPEGEAEKPLVAAPQIDGRQVPAAIRKALADMKATNPAVAKELNDYVWGYKNLKADIAKNFGPEGLKEAIALKNTVEELTGADSVEDFRTEVQELRHLDQQFISGDPEFIKTAVAKFPEGFKKIAPAMMDAWAQADPDSYDRRMAGIIVATLNQNGFGNNLARAVDFLEMQDPDKGNAIIQKVIGMLGEGQKSLSAWAAFSTSKPKAPEVDPNAAANAKERADIEAQKVTIFTQGVTKDLDVHSSSTITKELAALKKTVPESARAVFDKQVIDAVWAKMRGESNFSVKFKALMANKYHAGVLKFLQSRGLPYYAEAVESAYKRLYGTTKFAGAPKPKIVPGAKPGEPAPKAAAGWVKFNPPAALIDRQATQERDIVFAKKAILKDGRKVYWGDKIPT